MPRFTFKARDEKGQALTGTLDADTREEALEKLRAERKLVVELEEGAVQVDRERMLLKHAARSVKREEVIAFSGQLAVMLETGVPLGEAMRSFVEHSRSGPLRRVMSVVHESVLAGSNLSSAMASFPTVFPSLMVSLMRAAEASGTMGMMLARISEYLGKERRTKRQIVGAMVYPLVMVLMALTVTMFLVVWVLPRFARIYESRGSALPMPTRIVMGVSDVLLIHWPTIIGFGALIASALIMARSTKQGRRFLDGVRLRTPIMGPMLSQYYLTRATRTLATLLAAGVSVLDALRIVKGVTTNAQWEDLWDRMIHSVTSGLTMGEVAVNSRLIPPPVASMISAGERTGKLPETLDRVAEVAKQDLDEAVKTASQLMEPLMITVMGGLIGGVAIALLLPIFSISSVMSP